MYNSNPVFNVILMNQPFFNDAFNLSQMYLLFNMPSVYVYV